MRHVALHVAAGGWEQAGAGAFPLSRLTECQACACNYTIVTYVRICRAEQGCRGPAGPVVGTGLSGEACLTLRLLS